MTADLTTVSSNLTVGASVLLGSGGLFTWLGDPNTYTGSDSADRILFTCGGANVAYFAAASAGFNAFFPAIDNTYSLGHPTTFRWTAVHAVNGTIETSDARYKREIVDDNTLGLAFVRGLRVRGFKYLDDPEYRLGFVAQEVEGTLAGRTFAPLRAEGGIYGMNYAGFVPVLTTALQELDREVRDLREEVRVLRARQAS